MNSDWNRHFPENRRRFTARFPELAALIGLDSDAQTAALIAAMPDRFSLDTTASGLPTLSADGVFVHSRYNPLRDAERTVQDTSLFSAGGCVFAGCGLAYVPEAYALAHPESSIVLIEPDIFLFLLCLASRPLAGLLAHRELILVIGTEAREVCTLLEKTGLGELPVYESPALMAPTRSWFEEFTALRRRNREKKNINANTLKRFGDLWLRNMGRNLNYLRDLDGIGRFAGLFADQTVLVLAAGPSLDRILPRLQELRRHCLIIAVDTAVRACVRVGVEPDFIVLVDPQYWNYRHLDGLECPSSILIAESAVWPPVFRFNSRSVFLCSSLFPLGSFLEKRSGVKGELGAGGSVATTAWDFARHLGATKIVMAALDLGFPDKKTHFTGSIFEERTHTASDRLRPSETAGFEALYAAGPYPVPDYRGSTILTDKRLILYAWWFESRLAAYPEHHTSTLTPEGVRIPLFTVTTIDEVCSGPENRPVIQERLDLIVGDGQGEKTDSIDRKMAFDRALAELKDELRTIRDQAVRAQSVCAGLRQSGEQYRRAVQELERIDRAILENQAKEITAMVFPAPDKEKSGTSAAEASLSLYRSIAGAAEKNLRALEKYR